MLELSKEQEVALGLELAAKLRRGRHAQPVLLVTAYVNAEVLRDCQNAGVAECFSKPFAVDALRRSVRRALANVDVRRTPMRKAA